jgi:Cu-Zn family superoxide dismutase
MKTIFGLVSALTIPFIIGLTGCSGGDKDLAAAKPKADAIAILTPTDGNTVEGIVAFAKVEGGMRVMATVKNLTAGRHGFHIHEYGDCSAVDATSAGGHFNPQNKPHGAPDSAERHVGDLGNIEANQAGLAVTDFVAPRPALEGPQAIIGRSVIVHAKADDLKSQPTGAAGARLACGVIGYARK